MMLNFNSMNPSNPITIACDVDEIITNISPLWTYLLIKDNFFSEILKENCPKGDFRDIKFQKEVLNRPYFDLLSSFAKPEVEITKEIKDKFLSLYNNDNFYNLCTYTNFALGLSKIAYTHYIKKIYFVSRCMDKTINRKKELIENLFKDNYNKIEFYFLDLNESKGDFINKIGRVNIFIDDELPNVIDVINKNKEKEMDIYIPSFGYNIPTEALQKLANENNKKISYYQAF